MEILGIDIGGSGIKGALVDTEKGEFTTERQRIATPQQATPKAVIKTVKEIVDHFEYSGPIGVGIPSVVIDGVVKTAANIDHGWIGYPGQKGLAEATGCPVTLLNDADVAAIAERKFGAGHNHPGVMMVFTLGTGIGSSMFVHGRLVPNLELGHIFMRNQKKDAEEYASDRTRQDKDLDWKTWGKRLNEYFQYIEALFSPQLIIIGGGVSRKHERFLQYIDITAEVVPAELLNQAGIVGAALAAVREG